MTTEQSLSLETPGQVPFVLGLLRQSAKIPGESVLTLRHQVELLITGPARRRCQSARHKNNSKMQEYNQLKHTGLF